MPWEATITGKQTDDRGILIVRVNFSNGEKSYNEQLTMPGNPTPTWLNDTISQRLKQLASLDDVVVPIGKIEPTVEPPQDEEKLAWKQAFQKLQLAKTFIDLGVLDADDSRVADLRAIVVAGFNAYAGLGAK